MFITKQLISTFFISAIFLLFSQNFAYAKVHDNLILNGIASFEALKTEYFLGALYLEQPTHNSLDILESRGLKRMEIVVSKDKWRKRKFSEMWLSAININTDMGTQEKIGKYIYGFTQLPQGSLLAGDRITIDYTYKKGTKVYINDTLFQHIWHEEYFSVLLKAWIGNRPPSKDFKAAIIQASSNPLSTELEQRIVELKKQADAKRYALVKAWKAPKQKKIGKKTLSVASKNAANEQKDNKPANKKVQKLRKKEQIVTNQSANNTVELPTTIVPKKDAKAPEIETSLAEVKTPQVSQSIIYKTYQKNINRLAQKQVIYPTTSLNEQQQGVVSLGININRQGQLQMHELEKKTPFIALNNAAKAAVLAVNYPPLPEQLKDFEKFTINIEFSLE